MEIENRRWGEPSQRADGRGKHVIHGWIPLQQVSKRRFNHYANPQIRPVPL